MEELAYARISSLLSSKVNVCFEDKENEQHLNLQIGSSLIVSLPVSYIIANRQEFEKYSDFLGQIFHNEDNKGKQGGE